MKRIGDGIMLVLRALNTPEGALGAWLVGWVSIAGDMLHGRPGSWFLLGWATGAVAYNYRRCSKARREAAS